MFNVRVKWWHWIFVAFLLSGCQQHFQSEKPTVGVTALGGQQYPSLAELKQLKTPGDQAEALISWSQQVMDGTLKVAPAALFEIMGKVPWGESSITRPQERLRAFRNQALQSAIEQEQYSVVEHYKSFCANTLVPWVKEKRASVVDLEARDCASTVSLLAGKAYQNLLSRQKWESAERVLVKYVDIPKGYSEDYNSLLCPPPCSVRDHHNHSAFNQLLVNKRYSDAKALLEKGLVKEPQRMWIVLDHLNMLLEGNRLDLYWAMVDTFGFVQSEWLVPRMERFVADQTEKALKAFDLVALNKVKTVAQQLGMDFDAILRAQGFIHSLAHGLTQEFDFELLSKEQVLLAAGWYLLVEGYNTEEVRLEIVIQMLRKKQVALTHPEAKRIFARYVARNLMSIINQDERVNRYKGPDTPLSKLCRTEFGVDWFGMRTAWHMARIQFFQEEAHLRSNKIEKAFVALAEEKGLLPEASSVFYGPQRPLLRKIRRIMFIAQQAKDSPDMKKELDLLKKM